MGGLRFFRCGARGGITQSGARRAVPPDTPADASPPKGLCPVAFKRGAACPPADLVVPDAYVSRRHCEVRLQTGRAFVPGDCDRL